MDDYLHRKLREYGYGSLERHLNEWNNAHDRLQHGTSYASAAVAAMLCGMQGSHTDLMCYYDSRLIASAYGGLFAPLTYQPVCTYYSFLAFNELYQLKNQAECIWENRDEGLYALAATDGKEKAAMIVNHSNKPQEICLHTEENFDVYLLDREHFLTESSLSANCFTLAANQVALIKNHAE